MNKKTIGVLGGGAWGTAMAQALARGGNDVSLWILDETLVNDVNILHENTRFLKGFKLSPRIKATTSLSEAAENKEFLFIATPSLFLPSTLAQLLEISGIENGSTCIGVLTKGFIPSQNGAKLILEEMETILPFSYKKNLVYISGPSHAEEVAMGKLTGLIVASENPKHSIRFRELLRVPGLMVFSSLDVIGVQICAAAKNVIAIVFGILDAIAVQSDRFGDNTESLLLAAGLNEIQTLGFALGATHAETFTSIAGVGDLDVTCRSKYGRNRRFGHEIIQKNIIAPYINIDDIITNIKDLGYLPEGLVATKYVYEIAERLNIKLPICKGLYKILNKEIKPLDFLLEVLR